MNRRPKLQCVVVALLSLPIAGLAADAAAGEPGTASNRPAMVLNDSGVGTCIDADGNHTPTCKDTGQDGAFGRDATVPNPANGHFGFAFAKVCNSGQLAGTGTCAKTAVLGAGPDDWACTRDLVTGLTWEVKTSGSGVRGVDHVFTNYNDRRPGDASAYTAQMNRKTLCGIKSWRLPALLELMGIEDFGADDPGAAIDEDWFPNTRASADRSQSPYWASNGGVLNWFVEFHPDTYHGATTYPANPDALATVRLVSGTRAVPPAKRFSVFGDQVTDALTGLLWAGCVEGQVYNGVSCVGTPTVFTSIQATNYAYFLSVTTGVPWRVPNIKELASLFNDRLYVGTGLDFPLPSPDGEYISATPGVWFNYGPAYTQGLGSAGRNGAGYVRFVQDVR